MNNKSEKKSEGKFFIILDKIEANISFVCFSLMLIVVLIGVFLRYVIKVPNPWGEELSRYFMIYGIYIGIAMCVKQRAHIGVDVVINNLSGKPKKLVMIIGNIITIAAYILLTILSIQVALTIKNSGQVTASLRIPMYLLYLSIPLGFILSTIHGIELFIKDHVSNSSDNREEK